MRPNAVALLLFLPSEDAVEWHKLHAAAVASVHRVHPAGHVVGVPYDGYMVLRRAHAPSCENPAQCGVCGASASDIVRHGGPRVAVANG
jgi:hypothetical protein